MIEKDLDPGKGDELTSELKAGFKKMIAYKTKKTSS
jgi:hypothetical protein